MWILFSLYLTHSCTLTEYRSSCVTSPKFTLTTIPSSECSNLTAQQYDSLDCKFECQAGFYEKIQNGQQSCAPCPKGTFSISGFQYGSKGIPWAEALSSLMNECWSGNGIVNSRDSGCGWEVKDSLLNTKSCPAKKQMVAALTIPLKIVKPGNMFLAYKKKSERIDGKPVGLFSVYLNNKIILEDSEMDNETWKSFNYSLELGANVLAIEYFTDRSKSDDDPRAFISTLSVSGTKFADSGCYDCAWGGSSAGSSSCQGCDFNEYWSGGICEKCPNGTYSYKGSASVNDCKIRDNCTANDYKTVDSGCIDGLYSQRFEWKNPIFCDFSNSKLPNTIQGLPCKPCPDGYIFNQNPQGENFCVVCSHGTYSNNSTSGKCLTCSPGTVALKSLVIKDWSDLPFGFQTYCINPDNSSCKISIGWYANSTYISTGKNPSPDSTLVLSRTFIISYTGSLFVNYSIFPAGSTTFKIYINSILSKTLTSATNGVVIDLTQGENIVQFVYKTIKSDQIVKIFNIAVNGAEEGGAGGCAQCPEGFVIDEVKSICIPCPAGQTSNPGSAECTSCEYTHFSPKAGGKCKDCPFGTTANRERTNCVAKEFVNFDNNSFFIGNITGVEKKGICKMPSAQFYCLDSFYGPLSGDNKDFYISILNSKPLNLQSAEYFSGNSSGFAFLVHNKEDIRPGVSEKKCEPTKLVLNLGSVAAPVVQIENGLSIVYLDGDKCTENLTYSTNISIFCDAGTGIGWPIFSKVKGCTFEFLWKSKYGCPVCKFDEMVTTESECVDGFKTFKKIAGNDCILPFDGAAEWRKSCSEIGEAINHWPVIVVFACLGNLIVIGVISFWVFCRYKRRFDRLKDASEKI